MLWDFQLKFVPSLRDQRPKEHPGSTEWWIRNHPIPGLLAVLLPCPAPEGIIHHSRAQGCFLKSYKAEPTSWDGYVPGLNVLMREELVIKDCNTLSLGLVGNEFLTTRPSSKESISRTATKGFCSSPDGAAGAQDTKFRKRFDPSSIPLYWVNPTIPNSLAVSTTPLCHPISTSWQGIEGVWQKVPEILAQILLYWDEGKVEHL